MEKLEKIISSNPKASLGALTVLFIILIILLIVASSVDSSSGKYILGFIGLCYLLGSMYIFRHLVACNRKLVIEIAAMGSIITVALLSAAGVIDANTAGVILSIVVSVHGVYRLISLYYDHNKDEINEKINDSKMRLASYVSPNLQPRDDTFGQGYDSESEQVYNRLIQ
jgi:hypothetical protein